MEVSNIITIILFIISCVSIIISIGTFIKNGNKEVKADTSKDSYKWGQLDEKLNNLEKQVNKILEIYKKERYINGKSINELVDYINDNKEKV